MNDPLAELTRPITQPQIARAAYVPAQSGDAESILTFRKLAIQFDNQVERIAQLERDLTAAREFGGHCDS